MSSVVRSEAATIVIPTRNEWYKAAYYDSPTSSYFDYPTWSNSPPTCAGPTAAANSANCVYSDSRPVAVGSYTGSSSPSGTSDQGGNVGELTETSTGVPFQRFMLGGGFLNDPSALAVSSSNARFVTDESFDTGFRLVLIPEPGSDLLVIGGLLGLVGYRRVRA